VNCSAFGLSELPAVLQLIPIELSLFWVHFYAPNGSCHLSCRVTALKDIHWVVVFSRSTQTLVF